MADVKIQPAGEPVDPPEKPKLTATGQALQSALDTIGRGGERADLEAQLNQQVISARQSGDENTANALAALAFNYHLGGTSEAAAGSTTEGWAYLGNVQRDIAAGRYDEPPSGAPVAPTPPPTSPSPAQSAINAATNRLAAAERGGNPAAIAVAQRDLNQAKVDAVSSRTVSTSTTTSTLSRPGLPPAPSAADAVTAQKWPEVVALKQTLESIGNTTIKVQTVTDDEILRRYRARA